MSGIIRAYSVVLPSPGIDHKVSSCGMFLRLKHCYPVMLPEAVHCL